PSQLEIFLPSVHECVQVDVVGTQKPIPAIAITQDLPLSLARAIDPDRGVRTVELRRTMQHPYGVQQVVWMPFVVAIQVRNEVTRRLLQPPVTRSGNAPTHTGN